MKSNSKNNIKNKNIKENFNSLINEEHAGFAITLEVMATLFMLFAFISFTLYFLRVMNVQRFMNTVLTSTAEQASRWGGVDSNAYRENVADNSLLNIATHELKEVAPDFNPSINGTPDKISNDGDKITITISYGLPEAFKNLSKVTSLEDQYDMYNVTQSMHMQVSVNSIMEAGVLL